MRHPNLKKLLILLFFCFFFYSNLQIYRSGSPEGGKEISSIGNIDGLNPLASWNFSSIIIDDSGSGGNGTWSWVANQTWCSGNGTAGNPYIIENITVNSGESYGIRILDSTQYFVIQNCTIKNAQIHGISLIRTSNGRLIDNKLYANVRGIFLYEECHDNLVQGNTLINNTYGILLDGGSGAPWEYKNSRNVIDHNYLSGNNYSLQLTTWNEYSNITNNLLLNNGFNNEDDYGIELVWSRNNIIFNNTITNQKGTCIYINSIINGGDNSILNNRLMHGAFNGIQVGENDTIISGNFIQNQTQNGLITGSNNLEIFGNTFKDNPQIGISISSPTSLIYNNTFLNSGGDHADSTWGDIIDWNNSVIGNYWDDYSGGDQDDDGIGDYAYRVPNRFGMGWDYLPQWRDGPTINVTEPIQNEIYHITPPNFTIAISDPTLDTLWYSIHLGNTSYSRIISSNGTVNTTDWVNLGDGNVTLGFYGNDSQGNVNYTIVNIIKDALLPNITILSPNNTAIFGNQPPSFEVILGGADNSKTWYSLFNGTHWSDNVTFSGLIDQINQSLWADIGNGTVTVRFSVNDSANNIVFDEVQLFKDIIEPNITIIGELANETFGLQAPQFNLSIFEGNLDEIWYTLDGGLTNYSCSSSGQINSTLWESLSDGPITIRFYANDTVGNINYLEITIEKQTEQSPGDEDYLMEIILLATLIIGVIAAALTFRKIFRGVPPSPAEKPSWISTAFGYTPELERKFSILRDQPHKFANDVELQHFLSKPFTILPSEIITKLDRLSYSDEEKIEILQTLLILPPERRQRVLAKIIENPPREAAS